MELHELILVLPLEIDIHIYSYKYKIRFINQKYPEMNSVPTLVLLFTYQWEVSNQPLLELRNVSDALFSFTPFVALFSNCMKSQHMYIYYNICIFKYKSMHTTTHKILKSLFKVPPFGKNSWLLEKTKSPQDKMTC